MVNGLCRLLGHLHRCRQRLSVKGVIRRGACQQLQLQRVGEHWWLPLCRNSVVVYEWSPENDCGLVWDSRQGVRHATEE